MKRLSEVMRGDPRPEELELRKAFIAFFEMSDQDRAAELELIDKDPAFQKPPWSEFVKYIRTVHEADPDVRKIHIDQKIKQYEDKLRRRMIERAKY